MGNEIGSDGKRYILTYKVNEAVCSNFTQSEAESYCQLQGGRPVSLDDNERSQYFINLAIRDRKRYFWTGGKIDHSIEPSPGLQANKRDTSEERGSGHTLEGKSQSQSLSPTTGT